MMTVIVRALQSAIAVVAAIFAARLIRDEQLAKLVAVPFAMVAAIVIEYGMTIAPKRSSWIRRRLDPRAVFEGAWIQDVKNVVTASTGAKSNRFAVLTVTYSKEKYKVEGTAYDPTGKEHSRWWSTEQVHFSEDGRSLTYLWQGTVMSQDEGENDPNRVGFAKMQLSSDDSGTGRVDHVSMQVILIFNLERVTSAVVEQWGLGSSPNLLRSPAQRDRFAREYAKRRALAEC